MICTIVHLDETFIYYILAIIIQSWIHNARIFKKNLKNVFDLQKVSKNVQAMGYNGPCAVFESYFKAS